MSSASCDEVSAALRHPQALASYALSRWEALIPRLRSANLLGRVATLLDDGGKLADVPAAPRAHLRAALQLARAHRESTLREIDRVREALESTAIDVVLLKGAAYLAAGLAASRGRMFGDVDILVPHERLHEVEAALMLHGWATTHLNAYDQRYYREWMHELPPMQHVTRGTIVDVHHAILPRTARVHPESKKLLLAAEAVPHQPRLLVLAPTDMVLHSATHLFYNEDLTQALRDLVDLDALLREFGDRPSFWPNLLERADDLHLVRPLYYALRYVAYFLEAQIPPDVVQQVSRGAPRRELRSLMDALFVRALRPAHPTAVPAAATVARTLLYIRAHWLRMPPLLLARHLAIKTFRREPAEPRRATA